MPLRIGARLKADLVDRKILLHTPQEYRTTSQGDYDYENGTWKYISLDEELLPKFTISRSNALRQSHTGPLLGRHLAREGELTRSSNSL